MHDFDPSARDQDANALRVVLIYAAFAALWILLSDRLVAALFSDPAHILLASMLKGWLFVAITSLLLYGLIRGRARNAKVGAGGTPISRRGGFLLAALAILLLAGAGIGHSIERQREVQLTNLHSIAAAKSRQIAAWLTERRGDAELIRGSHYIAENFHSWLTGGSATEQNLKTYIDHYLQHRPFDAISLIDATSGRRWRSERAPGELAPPLRDTIGKAGAMQGVLLTPAYHDADGKPRLDLIAPLELPDNSTRLAVLHIRLDQEFFPLVRDWPYPLAGFESQLLRANGEQIEFITPLPPDADGKPFPSLTPKRSGLIAARALDATADPVEISGDDPRGIASLGVARRINGADWLLLVRLGESDLYAAAARDAAWIGLSSLLAMFMALTGFILLRQRDHMALMQSADAARDEKLRALQLLDAIAEQSEDAIFAKDLEGRYLLFNRAAASFVGKPASEVIGKDDWQLFPAEQAARIQANDRRGIDEGSMVVTEEVLDTALGQRVFHATKGPLYDSGGRVIGSFGISRDVTDATRADEELRQRNEELERFNRATVGRELDMIELKREINRLSRELGRAEPHALAFDRDQYADTRGSAQT